MTVSQLRTRLRSEKALQGAIDSALDKIGLTEHYIKELRVDPSASRVKHIKDNIWGMMEFSQEEMYLINSPIVQRLRRIRQLGFGYLTYPSAEHSRFIHTLGVAHVAKTIARSSEELASRIGDLIVGDTAFSLFNFGIEPNRHLRRAVIHAAIMHDAGHLAFSHAGESAFKAVPLEFNVGGIPISDFLGMFREQGFQSDLSECLSIAICLSSRFGLFYEKIVGVENPVILLDAIACLIGGIPPAPELQGLSNIISGSVVDADKIDYINRDSEMCGIPVGIDISRVFLNTSLIKIDQGNADQINKNARDGSTGSRDLLRKGVHFVVNASGIDTYGASEQPSNHGTIEPLIRGPFDERSTELCVRGVCREEEADEAGRVPGRDGGCGAVGHTRSAD